MSVTHTAQIFHFPRRPIAGAPGGLDFTRATPAATAPVEANQVRLSATVAARTDAERAELVSALLLTLENNPAAPCLCWPLRDIAGNPCVAVIVAGVPFRLRPDDCRTAADALVAEQAFPGCMQPAHDLREAANTAEQRGPASRPGGILTLASPSRTGMVTTVVLSVLIAATVLVARLFGR
ncbi:hypothetical protein [Brevundimonas sp. TWP2-3-4b1]|uniref:hypothetical protein n=1 Tax=Brevundimonas sp. TWP2-3-4b1 TaxID=2804580 RepID=UPI003CFA4D14